MKYFFVSQIREEYERLQKEAEERRIQQKTNPKVFILNCNLFFLIVRDCVISLENLQ